jgi:bacterioferritin-associated ferredoxin
MVVFNIDFVEEIEQQQDQIVCHCLQVTESTVREAADRCAFRSLCELVRETGAGSGCTACHRRLRRLLG